MTELLYQTDAYVRQFEALVVDHVHDAARNLHGVVLDRSAFYPGGGGQPCDFGCLISAENSCEVVKVGKIDGQIVHFCQGELPAVGQSVTGELDWERRYKLMRTHSAMHVLCGVVWRDYGAQVTGGNMEPLSARMDFEFETLQKALVGEIEAAINAEVAAARPVVVKQLARQEAFAIPDLIRTKINLLPEGIDIIRTVELVGLDLQADGGTHVKNTSEIGRITIPKYKSKGKINKRIYVTIEA